MGSYVNLLGNERGAFALKKCPSYNPNYDREKEYEKKIKEEKMREYRMELDKQIKDRPSGTYGKINNDRRIEVPPDPCK